MIAEFKNLKYQAQPAYLVNIFNHLNKMNLQLQGSGHGKLKDTTNIFVCEDKMQAFLSQIDLWLTRMKDDNFKSL